MGNIMVKKNEKFVSPENELNKYDIWKWTEPNKIKPKQIVINVENLEKKVDKNNLETQLNPS